MTPEQIEEQTDIVAQAKGRERFLRDRGEIKSPDIIAGLVAEIDRLRAKVEAGEQALAMIHPALGKSMAHFVTVEEWKGYKAGVTAAADYLRTAYRETGYE